MTHFTKHFTLDQANAKIPWVRSVFDKVHQIIATLQPQQPPPPPGNGHNGHGNGHNGHGQPKAEVIGVEQVWGELNRDHRLELINGLLQALVDEGIVIQDVPRGLIDFPAVYGGEEVLLCYELADGDHIVAWHDLTHGFAGRQPISSLPGMM